MIRVLHVYPQLNCGGTETVIYNLIKYGDKSRFKYDLLVQEKGENDYKFKELGCNIHIIPYTTDEKYMNDIISLLQRYPYDVIHTHIHSKMPVVLKAAKMVGIKHRVSHSHNARVDIPKILWKIFAFSRHRYEKWATDLFGCSEISLKWLFPFRWKDGKVIYNGIDLERFKFNSNIREQVRKNLQIQKNTKVFLNVGRLSRQKNQKFIIDLAFNRKEKNELYVIIGDGPLYDDLNSQKKDLDLKNVLLLGKRDDVQNWMQAADVFLFPSHFEGLGIVAIEAQASGLPVITTNKIPMEADMNIGLFHRVSLGNIKEWNKLMDIICVSDKSRMEYSLQSLRSNYNIKHVSSFVESIYQK